MMKSEFIELTGFEPTAEEYNLIEAEYMCCDVDKQKFCKDWLKDHGIQRMMRHRATRLELLEKELNQQEKKYEDQIGDLQETIGNLLSELSDVKNKVSQLQADNINLKKKVDYREYQLETIQNTFKMIQKLEIE